MATTVVAVATVKLLSSGASTLPLVSTSAQCSSVMAWGSSVGCWVMTSSVVPKETFTTM